MERTVKVKKNRFFEKTLKISNLSLKILGKRERRHHVMTETAQFKENR